MNADLAAGKCSFLADLGLVANPGVKTTTFVTKQGTYAFEQSSSELRKQCFGDQRVQGHASCVPIRLMGTNRRHEAASFRPMRDGEQSCAQLHREHGVFCRVDHSSAAH